MCGAVGILGLYGLLLVPLTTLGQRRNMTPNISKRRLYRWLCLFNRRKSCGPDPRNSASIFFEVF